MNFIFSVVPTILVLGILIMIHELGHFIACRLTGVEVEKFSIGFGPEILRWQGKRTSYVVSLFPLGGYVKPAGESVSEVDEAGPRPGDYLASPLWARIFIVCAGVLMNYILAFVIFVFMFMVGRPVPGTTVGEFVKGYPAETSGLAKGDRIISLNGKPLKTWTELTDMLQEVSDGAAQLTVERRGPDQNLQMVPLSIVPVVEETKNVFGETIKAHRLGIVPSPQANYFERYDFAGSVRHGFDMTVNLTVMTHKAIFSLIRGKLSMKSISGPVGIISMAGSAAQLGIPYVLQLMATLSVSLAVINLLPVPALDGGHLLFLLIEAVRRKKISLQLQERMTQIGFTLLLVLMVFLIYNDLVNIDAFGKIRGLFGS